MIISIDKAKVLSIVMLLKELVQIAVEEPNRDHCKYYEARDICSVFGSSATFI